MRILAFVLLLLPIISSQSEGQSGVPPGTTATLDAGDAIRITVWRNPDLSGEFEVADDGTVVHPLYRTVRVGGVPLAEAEADLKEFLEQFESVPRFVIQPLFRVAVGGEVRQPSLYSFTPDVTLAQAIAQAGGATERGRIDRVRLIRSGQVQTVDLTDPQSDLPHMPIRSGDQLFVERRVSIFRDYIAPVASVTSAAVSILGFILR